jgi:nucleoside-diphosphate-sugar epimerase
MVKKNFLITGGSGFIGFNIAKSLLKKHNVTIFDNNVRGSFSKFSFIKDKVKIINGDIRNYDAVCKSLKNINAVIHLAYINGTNFFYTKPIEVLEVATKGIVNIIDGCIKNKIKELYLASSSEVYQNPEKIPTKEDNVILKIPDIYNPRYSYGGGKILTELFGIHYGKKYFKKLIIFRPHNVYGEDMGLEHVIPQLIIKGKNLNKNKNFYIKGSGNEIRSFIYIDDFINAFNLLLEKGKHLQIYNIGTSDKIKIKVLANLILQLGNIKANIKKSPIAYGGTKIRCPDISKIKKLGFNPKINLIEGLKRTIAWYNKNITTNLS